MPSQKIACLNPKSHGVTFHIQGSPAAIACSQTNGVTNKISALATPHRRVIKGNNIGGSGVMGTLSQETLDWSAQHIGRKTPENVNAIIEVSANNAEFINRFPRETRPFVELVNNEDYHDDFGNSSLLMDPMSLGEGWESLNDQSEIIVNSNPSPTFIAALASETGLSIEDTQNAYGVIRGYVGNQEKAVVFAIGSLRAQAADRQDEIKSINEGLKGLKDIFSKEVDDGTQTKTHSIKFQDGAISFAPKRVFDYERSNPAGKQGVEKDEALTEQEYTSIIAKMEPKYIPLASIEKKLGDKAKQFINSGSTSLTIT